MFGKNTGKYFTNDLNGFRGKISQKKNISPQLFLSNFFETNIFSQNGIHYTFLLHFSVIAGAYSKSYILLQIMQI